MKKVLLLTAVMMLVASMAFAQAGTVSVTSDITGADCAIAGVAAFQVAVMHTMTGGATGVLYTAAVPPCSGYSFITDVAQFAVVIGSSQSGRSVGYGNCFGPTIFADAIFVSDLGTGTPCCPWDVTGVTVTDCTFVDGPGNGGTGIINQDGSCPCVTVPTEETTWGQVKSLYSE